MYRGTLQNCIAYFNAAPSNRNYYLSSLQYSCTTPDPGGAGNITNDPSIRECGSRKLSAEHRFALHQQGQQRVCARNNGLGWQSRIAYGVVDMGAYECQTPVGYWTWVLAITNGLTNADDDAAGDGYPNLLKYATGSDPTNSDDLARLACGPGSGWFSLWFGRNTNAADVTLVVEGADSISNDAAWNGIATNIEGVWSGPATVSEIGSSNPVSVTVQDTDPPRPTASFACA